MPKSLSKTPAPKKDRIYGSKKNPKGSASSEKSAKSIKLSADIIASLSKKLREFKENHKTDKVTLNDLKAVYRRGLGAYSSTHRPTISGGKPNTRNAWAMARVNAFLRKAGGGEAKKSYVQDDDLLKYKDGGKLKLKDFTIDGTFYNKESYESSIVIYWYADDSFYPKKQPFIVGYTTKFDDNGERVADSYLVDNGHPKKFETIRISTKYHPKKTITKRLMTLMLKELINQIESNKYSKGGEVDEKEFINNIIEEGCDIVPLTPFQIELFAFLDSLKDDCISLGGLWYDSNPNNYAYSELGKLVLFDIEDFYNENHNDNFIKNNYPTPIPLEKDPFDDDNYEFLGIGEGSMGGVFRDKRDGSILKLTASPFEVVGTTKVFNAQKENIKYENNFVEIYSIQNIGKGIFKGTWYYKYYKEKEWNGNWFAIRRADIIPFDIKEKQEANCVNKIIKSYYSTLDKKNYAPKVFGSYDMYEPNREYQNYIKNMNVNYKLGGEINEYVFLRFGLPNRNDKGEYVNSYSYIFGHKGTEEGGISVFEALKVNNEYKVFLSNSKMRTSFDELISSGRDLYLVEGEDSGNEGFDGEILLDAKTFKVIKKIDQKNVSEYNPNIKYKDGGEVDDLGEIFVIKNKLKSGIELLDAYMVVDKTNPFVLQFKNRAIYCLKFSKNKDGKWHFYNVAIGFTKEEFKEIKEKSLKPTLQNTSIIIGAEKKILYELMKYEIDYLISKGFALSPLFVDKYGVTYSVDKIDDDFYNINESFVKRGKSVEYNNSLDSYATLGSNVFKAINNLYKKAKEEKEMSNGGEVDEHKETYKKWKSLVNMSYSELDKFYNSKEGKEAGLSSSEAKAQGIDSGRESARWILKMKKTPHSKWTPTMWKWAKKQISFISRMSGNKGGLYDEKGNKTRKHTSLLIWGHNPKKESSMKYEEGGLTGDVHSLTDKLLSQKIQMFLKKVEPYKFYYVDESRNTLYVGFDENFSQDSADKVYKEATSSVEFFDADGVESVVSDLTSDTIFTIPLKRKVEYEDGGMMDVRMEDTVQRMDDPNFADPSYYKIGGVTKEKPQLEEVAIYYEEKGNFIVPRGTTYGWLYDVPNAESKLENGEFDFVLFPFGGSMFGMSRETPPLLKVWKKSFQKSRKGSEHLIGIVKGFYNEEEGILYIEMMTTRKDYRRKGVNSKIVKAMRDYFKLPQDKLVFVDTTQEGKKFEQAKTFNKGGKIKYKVKVTEGFTPPSNEFIQSQLKRLQSYKDRGYTKQMLVDDKKFSKAWLDKYYDDGGTINQSINSNIMEQVKFNQLPHIDTINDNDEILIHESVFSGNLDNPKHIGERYIYCQIMGKGGMLNSLNLKVLNSVGTNPLEIGKVITRPIVNVMNKGRKMGGKVNNASNSKFKDGGINPDNKEVKQYFAHDSGNAGGVLVGKRHSEGGIKAHNKSTGQPIEMEGGEVVITRGAVSNPKKYDFQGKEMTTREILSKLNVDGGGVSFAEGGDIPDKMNCGCDKMDFGGTTMSVQDFVNHSDSEYQNERLKAGMQKERNDHYTTLSKLNAGSITIEQALREIAQKEMKLNSNYPFGE